MTGTTYYYKVRAVPSVAAAASAYSAAKSLACKLATPTITVSGVIASGKIKISWGAVENAANYRVYRATSKTGTYSLLKTTTARSYTDTSAAPGKTYYYKVRAMATDTAASSSYSAVKSGVCKLAQPVVTMSNVASSGKIKLTWAAVSGVSKYTVYRADSKTGTYKAVKTTTARSYTDTTAVAGKTYYYKVRALSTVSAAHSAYSAIKSATCDLAQPALTVGLTSGGDPKLSWKTVSKATKYQVYRSTKQDSGYSLVKTTTATTFTDTTAKAKVKYYYKVRAVMSVSAATSAWSAVKSVTAK